jgi:hypothetical protein
MKLKVVKSLLKSKKYTAFFTNPKTKKIKRVHFGASGYRDFTLIKDSKLAKKVKENYQKRHKHDNIKNYMTPGSLSWYLLWGKSKNLKTNISSFKKKFKLK